MTTLFLLCAFFFLMVCIYPLICLVLTIPAWVLKKVWLQKATGNQKTISEIDYKIDQLKTKAFHISIVLIFFIIAPALVFYFMFFNSQRP